MKGDFSKIIRDSIKITKANKRLWVLGLVLATLGAGSSMGGGGNFGDMAKQFDKTEQNNSVKLDSLYNLDDLKDLKNLQTPSQNLLNTNLLTSAEQLPQVLGASTTSLMGLFKLVPLSFYGALGLLLIVAIFLGIAVSLYGQSWAQSGLIAGINRQYVGESLSLYQMSDQGKLNAVQVIKIRIFPALLFGLAVMLSALVLVIPGMLLGDRGKALLTILGIFYSLAVIIAGILLGASVHLGVYAINLESLAWKSAFTRGFKVFKSYFLDVVIMSIINCFAGCLVGIATLIVIAVLIGVGALSVMGAIAVPPLVVLAGPVIFLAIIAFIFIAGLMGAIFTVFKQSTWVLLYKQLTEEAHSTN